MAGPYVAIGKRFNEASAASISSIHDMELFAVLRSGIEETWASYAPNEMVGFGGSCWKAGVARCVLHHRTEGDYLWAFQRLFGCDVKEAALYVDSNPNQFPGFSRFTLRNLVEQTPAARENRRLLHLPIEMHQWERVGRVCGNHPSLHSKDQDPVTLHTKTRRSDAFADDDTIYRKFLQCYKEELRYLESSPRRIAVALRNQLKMRGMSKFVRVEQAVLSYKVGPHIPIVSCAEEQVEVLRVRQNDIMLVIEGLKGDAALKKTIHWTANSNICKTLAVRHATHNAIQKTMNKGKARVHVYDEFDDEEEFDEILFDAYDDDDECAYGF